MHKASFVTFPHLSLVLPSHWQYYISEHGQVKGEQNMMAEISANGPIACTVAVTAAFENYVGGIFNDTTGAKVSPTALLGADIHWQAP